MTQTGGTPVASFTLTPCPAGIDYTSGAGYQVYISDAGNSEAVSVTSGTTGSGNCTIGFTPFFNHSPTSWQLWNCGNNVPQVVGNPLAIVSQQFDMRPNPTTGVITGAIYGSNQILCGNVFSTQ